MPEDIFHQKTNLKSIISIFFNSPHSRPLTEKVLVPPQDKISSDYKLWHGKLCKIIIQNCTNSAGKNQLSISFCCAARFACWPLSITGQAWLSFNWATVLDSQELFEYCTVNLGTSSITAQCGLQQAISLFMQ